MFLISLERGEVKGGVSMFGSQELSSQLFCSSTISRLAADFVEMKNIFHGNYALGLCALVEEG